MFELGFTQLGIVGGIIVAVGLYTMAEHNKFVGLWILYGGMVIAGAGVFVHFHKVLAESEHAHAPPPKPDSPDRAWVALEMGIAGPLAYDAVDWQPGTRWHIPFRVRLTNTGNTPATKVDFFADMRPFLISYWPDDQIKDGVPQGQPVAGTDAPAELKKLCETALRFAQMSGGKTLFKGQSTEFHFHINGNPTLFDAARNAREYSGNILVFACATYKTTTDDRWHQTAESFAIYRPNAKIILQDGTVPQAEIRMTSEPMGGDFAN